MFQERLISSVVIVALIFGSMYIGGWVWTGLVMLLILGAQKEYADMMKVKGYKVPLPLLQILAVLMVGIQSYNIGIISELAIVLSFVAMVTWLISTQDDFANYAYGLVGYMMLAWSLSFLVCLENIYEGWWITLLAFLVVWTTDAGAYCIGMLIGKHKMAPVISPKKSWEGAIGGTLCCLLAVNVYNDLFLQYPWWFMTVLALVCSVLGQIGDLLESWLKRWVGVKDSGDLIPGHGGLMDRFDSMVLVAPLLYYLLVLYHSVEIYFDYWNIF
ncbi:MAG: phosphatidate cytidylyltransferase [Firmicutes bacterium]|nr:phosphatidate cytidylyltransferase [Bacillota bacterium]